MQVTIANTYGAALVGLIIAALWVLLPLAGLSLMLLHIPISLYGVTCVQTCCYNMTSPNDSRTLKVMVRQARCDTSFADSGVLCT